MRTLIALMLSGCLTVSSAVADEPDSVEGSSESQDMPPVDSTTAGPLLDPEWVASRIAEKGIDLLLMELKPSSNPAERLVHHALLLSRPILLDHREQTRSQLQARLLAHADVPELAAFQSLPDGPQLRCEWPSFVQADPGFRSRWVERGVMYSTRGRWANWLSTAASADSATAIVSRLGKMEAWDLATNTLRWKFEDDAADRRWYSIGFTGAGDRMFARAEDGRICIWDATTGDLLQTLTDPSGAAGGVVISANGEVIASITEDELTVWDLADGEIRCQFFEREERIKGYQMTPDGSRAVATIGDKVVAWDLINGLPLATYESRWGGGFRLAISDDGTMIANIEPFRGILIRELATANEVLLREADADSNMAFTPDGSQLLFVSSDGRDEQSLEAWDVATGMCLGKRTLHRSEGHIYGISLSADGESAVLHGTQRHNDLTSAEFLVWDINAPYAASSPAHEGGVGSPIILSGDGGTAVARTGSGGVNLAVWDIPSGELRHTLLGDAGELLAISLSADGSVIVSGAANTYTPRRSSIGFTVASHNVWDAGSGELLRRFDVGWEDVIDAEITPDGRIAVAAFENGRIITRDLEREGVVSMFDRPDPSGMIGLSPDGRLAAFPATDKADIVVLESGETILELPGAIRRVHFRDDSTIVAASGEGMVSIWGLESGELLRSYPGPANWHDITADGRYAVSTHDKCLQLWEIPTGECLCEYYFQNHPSGAGIDDLAHRAFTASAGQIHLFSIDGLDSPD